MKRRIAALLLAGGLCTSLAAQELAPADKTGAFKAPPTPIPVLVAAKEASAKEPAFAAMSFACYGGQDILLTAQEKCRSARDWAELAEAKCADACVKIVDKRLKKPVVKCGVNSFGLSKACN